VVDSDYSSYALINGEVLSPRKRQTTQVDGSLSDSSSLSFGGMATSRIKVATKSKPREVGHVLTEAA